MAKAAPTSKTIRQTLCWSYANLAMAHAALVAGAKEYSVPLYSIRSRMNKGLLTGSMRIGPLADEERLKLILPRGCCYCGAEGTARNKLTVDHVLASSIGGPDSADNIVWSCASCNSSKGNKDLLAWLEQRGEFAPLLLLRRYLKLAFAIGEHEGVLDLVPGLAPALPFDLTRIPQEFPAPRLLRLWVVPLDAPSTPPGALESSPGTVHADEDQGSPRNTSASSIP